MLNALNEIESAGLTELASIEDAPSLESWRVSYIGTKGKIRGVMPMMKDVSKEDKAAVGKRLNEVKTALESGFKEKQSSLKGGAQAGSTGPSIDLTEPGIIDSHTLGREHIITRVRGELVEIFARLGFEVAQGPELEDEDHNFTKLNIPAAHPARDPIDNFYVDDPSKVDTPRMLRSQTSTVQIRTMEDAAAKGWGPPIKIVSPGRVYRPDTVDATHSFMFHQIEGLYIDRDVSMSDLMSTLLQFARAYFGEDADVRLRPSFFPFTEPSAEFDMMIALKPGSEPSWIELGGCGMVDPNVLTACGIDPEEWTGFAFGFGIERIAMGKYGIPDIRMLFENDVRFLQRV
ncbi:MAG: phenylalanine--tRNA ligase subunit alpha [Phycisphaerales bacterium]|nr:phenylalanine--tRNA ligase subunit alpha [Phycisphaerales bacterium]